MMLRWAITLDCPMGPKSCDRCPTDSEGQRETDRPERKGQCDHRGRGGSKAATRSQKREKKKKEAFPWSR